MTKTGLRRNWVWLVIGVIACLIGWFVWQKYAGQGQPAGIASGNGRIEAVEVDISTKAAGRIKDVTVDEGDLVQAGQVLAHMDIAQLEAQSRQALAEVQRAVVGVDTASSLVKQRQAEKTSADAVVAQRQAELDSAQIKEKRSEQLVKANSAAQQVLDDDRAAALAAKAALSAAQAQVAASEAALSSSNAQVIDAKAAVDAARAAAESIQADIDDSTLKSPLAGRIQYKVAQPGEVLAAGGRVLDLVDLSDVYMTFFLPTDQAGRVALGADVRLVLDAAPKYVIPAKVTFVDNVAQFTPKTVETADERQKLMFRIKAKIPEDLLRKYIQMVKTGLPGVAYVKLDPQAVWPKNVEGTVVQ
ncbi:HlyD family secretion protein [Rhizobium sp. P28RR-XV]|uniref:HlyD family secretion protein n=1 Tax=Rhizobium sp. P28RR-XV TaxID=2726737 RepID=UPI001456919D|nr:efflux RND transporter periplasmic adaptor subunit [Rhizobium sp. P28RR-XV]NLR86352.1 HlyD family efflux transporter periplasmic adaptor subunit [Rhizobium sp. P28RR-XV]